MFHYLTRFEFLHGTPWERLFSYITFRAAFAAITAFIVSLILGPWLIRKLREWKIREVTDSTDSAALNELHKNKKDTPTMGGLLIIASIVISAFLWSNWNFYALSMMALVLCLGGVGFIDDYLKLTTRGKGQLKARMKTMYMLLVIIPVAYMGWNQNTDDNRTCLFVPFFKDWFVEMRAYYVLWAIVVIYGAANAVNLTDGLDGLATGTALMVGGAFVVIAYLVGHANFSGYLQIPSVSGAGEIAVVCSALCGACLGFLWFNAHPAEVFMGDTGSLVLGGIIGYSAVIIKQELLLVIAGGIFVVEALSVILQVGYFKLTRGQRLFRCAPLHHHFQMSGWPETKIVIRFWIIGIILAVFTLATLKIR